MTLIASQSPDDEASDDRTVIADSDSLAAQSFVDTLCKLETDAVEIEATLKQIASGLQSAAEGYLTLASHLPKLTPYELPQMIAQIPPPPIDVPMPIRKALSTEGENKTIHSFLLGTTLFVFMIHSEKNYLFIIIISELRNA